MPGDEESVCVSGLFTIPKEEICDYFVTFVKAFGAIGLMEAISLP